MVAGRTSEAIDNSTGRNRCPADGENFNSEHCHHTFREFVEIVALDLLDNMLQGYSDPHLELLHDEVRLKQRTMHVD